MRSIENMSTFVASCSNDSTCARIGWSSKCFIALIWHDTTNRFTTSNTSVHVPRQWYACVSLLIIPAHLFHINQTGKKSERWSFNIVRHAHLFFLLKLIIQRDSILRQWKNSVHHFSCNKRFNLNLMVEKKRWLSRWIKLLKRHDKKMKKKQETVCAEDRKKKRMFSIIARWVFWWQNRLLLRSPWLHLFLHLQDNVINHFESAPHHCEQTNVGKRTILTFFRLTTRIALSKKMNRDGEMNFFLQILHGNKPSDQVAKWCHRSMKRADIWLSQDPTLIKIVGNFPVYFDDLVEHLRKKAWSIQEQIKKINWQLNALPLASVSLA